MNILKDKVAIITGGASGIGFETAKRFASEGALIVIWDVQEEKGAQAVQQIKDSGAQAFFSKVNTASFEACEQAAKTCF
ncbi:MAG: SDR family NAD(P)-dependent oxidoreductase, partial [Bacteroidia bacterium]